ncbi:hypothetical protein L914_18892 [Phytophthora nicotianae]|uniref:RxLR effector protein n=1 Tax=Phytophthora nicotianae TaxID=4792 RepID=W2MC78_PHYNI|nr:hypothetical protein L914_18892 [Phytophthora nicotianae]
MSLTFLLVITVCADSSNGSVFDILEPNSNSRHLRGTLNHAKTNDEERNAAVVALVFAAEQARAEHLVKQGGKVAAANHAKQSNKIGGDKISGALTSTSKKDRAGAIAFFAVYLGLPLAVGAVIHLLAKSRHTTSGEQ